MAKRKPDARRDALDLQDLLKIYAVGEKTAMLVFLNDGKTTGVLTSGNGVKILSTCTRGVADLICRMAKDKSSAIGLAEKMGALIPAIVRSNCDDDSVLDALITTVGADVDKDD